MENIIVHVIVAIGVVVVIVRLVGCIDFRSDSSFTFFYNFFLLLPVFLFVVVVVVIVLFLINE